MELTTYLSKVIGLSLVIIGLVIALRRRYFMPVFGMIAEDKLTRATLAIVELVAGLALVVAHNIWAPAPAAVISFFGWLAVIEATSYLILPDSYVEKWIKAVSTPAGYIGGGAFAVVVGIYLAGSGFSWW